MGEVLGAVAWSGVDGLREWLVGWFDGAGQVWLLSQTAKSGEKCSSHVPSVHRWTHLGDERLPN